MNYEKERQDLMNKNRRLIGENEDLTKVNKELVNTLLAIRYTKSNDADLVASINKVFNDIKN